VSKLDDFLRRVGDEQDALRGGDNLALRIASRFRHAPVQPRRRPLLWAALAAALGFAAVLGGFAAFRERRSLAVSVGNAGGTPLVGAWLGAPDASALPLDFSDGSRFELAPSARARVVELAPAKARVELASGSLNVHVIPGRGIGWHIDAGPFGVRITGTRFVVSYAPEGDAFELWVSEGQVELSGCMLGNGRKVIMGQRVRASCSKRTLEVSYPDVTTAGSAAAPARVNSLDPPAATPEAMAPPAATDGTEPARPSTASSSAAVGDWLALARTGKFAEAHAAVEREGFESASLRAGPDALLLLAEVERHARQPRRAEEALLGLRRKFAGSNDAALAAFTLGRLEFDERGAYPAAAQWFRTYLKERPRGVMAREALGRLIEASQRAQDTAGARALAERYLREYPNGPHAELASRLVASP
jgi:TolA-binding protein